MRQRTSRTLTILSAVALVACGGADAQLEPRFVAVHNAMQAMGMSRLGPISEGSLPEGAQAVIETELEGGECYTFVALGQDGVRDLDVRVLDEGDDEVGRDTTHDRHAAAQVCPDSSGTHAVEVRMVAGQGGYTLAFWSGGASVGGGGAVARRGGAAGSCESPIPLELGRPVQGNTQQGQSSMQGSCAEGNAPEIVYRLEVRERVQVQAVLQSAYDGALYLMRTCGQPQSELACNDDDPDTSRSVVQATLEPGEYYLVVDGYGNESGSYELIASASPLQSVAAICDDAPVLPLGQPVTGSTAGQANYFQATCAGGAQSGDRVYRLDVPQRSRLRVAQQTDHDGALYLRRACEDATTELACNDDYADRQHSLITTVLEQGRYFVFTDGFRNGNEGNFTLTAELTSDTGGGATADECGSAGTLAAGQQLSIDTFEARDDYAGSCGGRGSPDVVYDLTVRNRSRLRVDVQQPQFDGTLYVRRTCADEATEVACSQVAQGSAGSLEAMLQPGRYALVIDGQRPETFGAMQVQAQLDDLAQLERQCRRAPLLQPGREVVGDTATGQDQFQASCAGGARSNDVVYRLRVRRRSTVRVSLSSDYDGALHLRGDCVDPSSEIACNDDHEDNRHSFVEATVEPGTYFVVVDGFSTGNQGSYTLDVEVTAQ